MARSLSIAIICFCLLGCSLIPGLGSDDTDNQQAALQYDESCVEVARQRAQDAGYNGYDRDMQKRIYEYSYTECVAGRKKFNH